MDGALSLIEKTAFLKNVDVLESIPTEALAEIAARATELRFAPDEVIYREGDPNRGVFLVVEGLLEQRKGRAIVRLIQPGMGVGEFWIGPEAAHLYTVTALEDTHLLNVTRDDMIDGMLDFPEFGVAMTQALGARVHELTGRVLELENLIARLHGALAKAGIEPPDPRRDESEDREGNAGAP